MEKFIERIIDSVVPEEDEPYVDDRIRVCLEEKIWKYLGKNIQDLSKDSQILTLIQEVKAQRRKEITLTNQKITTAVREYLLDNFGAQLDEAYLQDFKVEYREQGEIHAPDYNEYYDGDLDDIDEECPTKYTCSLRVLFKGIELASTNIRYENEEVWWYEYRVKVSFSDPQLTECDVQLNSAKIEQTKFNKAILMKVIDFVLSFFCCYYSDFKDAAGIDEDDMAFGEDS
jgi:hypothetical protein